MTDRATVLAALQTLNFEYNLRAFMLADANLQSLVADRIFPAPAPQNTPAPYITFQRVSTDRVYDIYGYAKLCGPLVQIDSWSDAPEYNGSYAEARLIGESVRQLLNGFRGMMGPLVVQETTISAERDLFEAQDHTRRLSFDFRFWFAEDDGQP
jgi:hypothetical protein